MPRGRIGAAGAASLCALLALLPGSTSAPAAEPAAPWTVAKGGDWKELEPGLELLEESLDRRRREGDAAALVVLKVTAVRIDPKRFALAVRMNPAGDGRTLADVARADKVPVVVNGAYFGKEDEPVTLLVSSGRALSRFNRNLPNGGVFALDGKGRAVVVPFKDFKEPGPGADFAVQNSPLLVSGGKAAYKDPRPARHRRTAIGVAADGRVTIAVCDSEITLDEWAAVLASGAPGGLGLDSALNLDGGPSTGLAVEHEKARVRVPSGRLIPHVLTVARRERPPAKE